MKAIIIPEFGDADVLKTIEIDTPQPKSNEMLINVHAAGINRADILQRRGQYPPPPGDSEIMGLEVAGTVSTVGENVEGFSSGDRVFGLTSGGGYAEQAILDYRLAMPIPEQWNFTMAAGVTEVFFTANENLFTLGKLTSDEAVLIHAGGSGVGTAAIQMASLAGANVFATAGSWEKVEGCLKLGCKAVINYKTQDFVEETKNLTEGLGVHLIQDFIGAAYLDRNLKVLRHQGRLALIGLLGGAQGEISLSTIISKRLQIFGFILRSLSIFEKIEIKKRFEMNWLPQLIAGQIRPIIDSVFTFDQVIDAHKYMESNQHFGKLILVHQ